MKKKIVFGVVLIFFVCVNLFQTFQFNANDLTLDYVMLQASANGESGNAIYFEDIVVEDGLCDHCKMGLEHTCSCTRYSTYCPSGGAHECTYEFEIVIDEYDCTPDGGSC